MKARDLRDRSTEDLAELEKSLAGERFQSKFKNFTNRLDDTSVIRKQKRDLARVKLILTERARGITVISKPREEGAEKPKTRTAKPVVQTAPSAAAAETTAAPSKTEKAPAKAKAAKTETKPAAEKKSAAAKPAAKKAKAKEETK